MFIVICVFTVIAACITITWQCYSLPIQIVELSVDLFISSSNQAMAAPHLLDVSELCLHQNSSSICENVVITAYPEERHLGSKGAPLTVPQGSALLGQHAE